MELKEKLQHLFNNDYPGMDTFISEVIIPIFGDDIDYKDVEFLETPAYRERADKAGIQSLRYIADIKEQNYTALDIILLDITVKNNVNIERSRVNIQQLIRSIMDRHHHILMVFHYDAPAAKSWRFSYAYKQDTQTNITSAKRFTYVFGRDFRARTAAERFDKLAKSPRTDSDFVKAFSVEALNIEFFHTYRAYYAAFVQFITGEKYSDEKELLIRLNKFDWLESDAGGQFESVFGSNGRSARDYIKKMFGRIVFLYFLQRKGWLVDNDNRPLPHYMRDLFQNAGDKQATFLDDVLETLFFYVLNTEGREQRLAQSLADGRDVRILPGWEFIPYLNGGLFSQDDIDPKKCVFPASYFRELFNFLDSYNFTIDENDKEDAEIGIDPEMLGRIFENLLEDNKDKGAFYTPKPIVDFMCREAIIAYLQKGFVANAHPLIREFVEKIDASLLNREQADKLLHKLIDVKICDPAIGSGAFPMGVVNILSRLFVELKPDADTAKMKLYIMRNNIHGVDIEQGAVDIARLRFWLSMVVEEDTPSPLPNLNFKIMQGHSLLESFKGRDLSAIAGANAHAQQSSLPFDDSRAILRQEIEGFYSEHNHVKSRKKMARIKDMVISQIFDETQDQNFLDEVKDVTGNNRFFLWHTWFGDVFRQGGFDIVIGNPPYLKEGRADKAIFAEIKDSPYYQGKMDLWYVFACRGIDMLKPGGNLCFIATNNWTTSAGAKKLRNHVLMNSRILKLLDFRDFMIFESASIQTMIMQFQKIGANDSHHANTEYTFDMRNLLGNTLTDVEDLLAMRQTDKTEFLTPTVNPWKMRDKYLTFSSTDDLLDKIYEAKIRLSSDEVANGIHPHYDFVNRKLSEKHGIPIGSGIFGLSLDEVNSLELTSEEMTFIKPYINSGETVHRYYTEEDVNLRIIYTTSEYKNPKSMDNFPNLKKHLDRFANVISSDNKPYGLHRSRKESFFLGEKIAALRKCVGKPMFSYSAFDCYFSATFYCIKTNKLDLQCLTALLNSKLIEFWLRKRGKMQGLNFQLDAEPLMQIPIAKPSEEVQNRLKALHQDIVDKLSVNKDADISDIENKIDHIVYHLYGLTYEEVLVIDPETPITREEYKNFNMDEA